MCLCRGSVVNGQATVDPSSTKVDRFLRARSRAQHWFCVWQKILLGLCSGCSVILRVSSWIGFDQSVAVKPWPILQSRVHVQGTAFVGAAWRSSASRTAEDCSPWNVMPWMFIYSKTWKKLLKQTACCSLKNSGEKKRQIHWLAL